MHSNYSWPPLYLISFPLLTAPSSSQDFSPHSFFVCLFYDSLCLNRDVCVTMNFWILMGLPADKNTEGNYCLSPQIHSQPMYPFPQPTLTFDRPSLLQTQCCQQQLLWDHGFNDCALPRRQDFMPFSLSSSLHILSRAPSSRVYQPDEVDNLGYFSPVLGLSTQLVPICNTFDSHAIYYKEKILWLRLSDICLWI